MDFFYISNVLIINNKMHKHCRRFDGINKYLMNQYVMRILCFPRVLPSQKKFLARVFWGDFPHQVYGQKVRPGCQCYDSADSLKPSSGLEALERTQGSPEINGKNTYDRKNASGEGFSSWRGDGERRLSNGGLWGIMLRSWD
jgi:hypothetical protein